MADTAIDWTDKVWNPVRGCAIVSAGCKNCYAMRQAHRFSRPGAAYEGLTQLTKRGPVWTGAARFVPDKLPEPLTWSTPARVFVNSMSDLFHGDVTDEEIAAVFGVMAGCPQHTFQILTKRPARMLEWFRWVAADVDAPPVQVCEVEAANRIDCDQLAPPWPLPNVWLGVSVEDQPTADARIPLLLQTPAAVRFVSAEPLLGPIDLDYYMEAGRCEAAPDARLHWVIAGGESGPGARPCCVSWLRNIVHDCEHAGVPVFVKQMGARPYEAADSAPLDDGAWPVGNWLHFDDRKGGDPAEWTEYLRVRQFPEARHG